MLRSQFVSLLVFVAVATFGNIARAEFAVDDFTQGAFSLTSTAVVAGGVNDTDTGINALGGARYAQLVLYGGTSFSAVLGGGAVNVSMAGTSEGQFSLQYNQNGPYDLASHGNAVRVTITGATGDFDATLAAIAFSSGTSPGAYVAGVDFNGSGTYDLPFSSFTEFFAGAPLDFSNLNSLGISLTSSSNSGGGAGFQIADISIVPEPQFLGLTLLMSVCLRRRSRRV